LAAVNIRAITRAFRVEEASSDQQHQRSAYLKVNNTRPAESPGTKITSIEQADGSLGSYALFATLSTICH
jgi:hypothetical protein